jgi:hypothetical protein
VQGGLSHQFPEARGEGGSGKGYTARHQIDPPRLLRLFMKHQKGTSDLLVAHRGKPSGFCCLLVLIEIRANSPNE